MLINTVSDKLDIIVLAGQSNAEGYGLGPVENPYMPDARVLSMRDTDNYGYVVDEKSRGTFNITLPRRYVINIAEERQNTSGKIGCLANSFASRYREECLAPDRRLLIIHSAVGATGFAKQNWGVGNVLSERMIRMCELALGMNPENRVVALLWHQGEHDAIFRPELTDDEREKLHTDNLSAMFAEFREKCGEAPIIMGTFADEWAKSAPRSEVIVSAMRNISDSFSRAALADASGLPTNNQDLGNGDAIHFSRNSLYKFGERYFEVYKLVNNG